MCCPAAMGDLDTASNPLNNIHMRVGCNNINHVLTSKAVQKKVVEYSVLCVGCHPEIKSVEVIIFPRPNVGKCMLVKEDEDVM